MNETDETVLKGIRNAYLLDSCWMGLQDTENHCGTCRFFVPHRDSHRTHIVDRCGYCRRYPPVVSDALAVAGAMEWILEDERVDVSVDSAEFWMALWEEIKESVRIGGSCSVPFVPTVMAHADWCGECYRSRIEAGEELWNDEDATDSADPPMPWRWDAEQIWQATVALLTTLGQGGSWQTPWDAEN